PAPLQQEGDPPQGVHRLDAHGPTVVDPSPPLRSTTVGAASYPVLVSAPRLRVASFAELTARQLHDLLRLRVDVFVVEQECAYPELDGRDTEPGTQHLWAEVGGE